MKCECGRPSKHLGLCRYRRSKIKLPPRPRKKSIDLGLEILELIRPPREPIPLYVIAEICGCSFQNIQQIESKAIRKLKEAHELRTNKTS